MPFFLVFLVRHALVGFALSAGFVAAILWSDAGGLGALLTASHEHPLPLLLLWFFAGLTFGGVQMAAAIMLEAHPPTERPRGGTLVPVPVRARAARRR